MEIRTAVLIGAFVFAALSGVLLACSIMKFLAEKMYLQRATTRFAHEGSSANILFSQGLSFLRLPASLLLKSNFMKRRISTLVEALKDSGFPASDQGVVSFLMGLCLTVLLLATAISQSLLCGAALVISVLFGVALWAGRQNDKRQTQLREAIPEALQLMKACFQVGYSLKQTIHEVHVGTAKPLADVFGEMEGILETGGDTKEALSVLQKTNEPELIFLATALEIQHKTGSSMQQVLEITRQSVADEIELKRTLRTQTAQAKLSAQIVTVMPFALIGVFSLVSPGFLDPFFESTWGVVLLALAVGMQVLGVSLVRRLLKVEVV